VSRGRQEHEGPKVSALGLGISPDPPRDRERRQVRDRAARRKPENEPEEDPER
jgi:hypothetical protein